MDNFERSGEIYRTGFLPKEQKIIEQCKDSVVLLHNHSLNGRPSGQDLLAYLRHDKIKLSLIICHDGTIYGIYGVKPAFERAYSEVFERFKEKSSDLEEIKRLTMTELYIYNDQLSDRHKLFYVQKL